MAVVNCDACNDLRTDAPDFVANGVTSAVCESLHENTGFNPNLTVLHEDEEDLHLANDCLIGNMTGEIEAYDTCDWKEFMKKLLPNLYETLKAIICSIGGLWNKLQTSTYIGILKLYSSTLVKGDGSSDQAPAFDTVVRQGNMPATVLTALSTYKGIKVTNTLDEPILVDCTFNCSIETSQNIACCYIAITRDGNKVGQTPFITPHTYDQQCSAEPFILQPGQTTTLNYHFHIGVFNAWYWSQFGGTSEGAKCVLDANSPSPSNQRSYFLVKAVAVSNVH